MTDTDSLKPCPACHGTATFLGGWNDEGSRRFVACESCRMKGPTGDRDGSRWNALPRRDDAQHYDGYNMLDDELKRRREARP